MERVIDCPVCYDTDNCFEDVQENYSSYLCFHCGFMSDSRYEISSLQLVENLKKSPLLVQKLKFEDKHRNIVWFPSVINMGELGMIFPEGTPEEYVWKYAKVVDVPKEEQHKYDNYDKRLDVENAKEYSQYEFLKACKEMGITRDLKQNA
jgi:hypothetical protein